MLHRAYGVVTEVTDRVLLDLDEVRRAAMIDALEILTRGSLATPRTPRRSVAGRFLPHRIDLSKIVLYGTICYGRCLWPHLSLPDPLSWALTALTATQLMVILDGTIVNVALPTIRADLGFSGTGLAWVVNAFFVAFALLLLPAGRLADLVGARRVFLGGLVVFTAASALCGLAPGPELLVAARFVQGVGGALARPSCSA